MEDDIVFCLLTLQQAAGNSQAVTIKMRACKVKNCKDSEGNCPTLAMDGFPAQCIDFWAKDKYYFLEKYMTATRGVRKKFADNGNAVFIDLFSGPGKCIIKNQNTEIESGCLRAVNNSDIPFNKCYFCDISKTNVNALIQRTKHKSDIKVTKGDANIYVDELVSELKGKDYSYHFAYIDPFGPEALKFETIRKLSALKRMDILLHFPVGAIKRNLPIWMKKRDSAIPDNFFGTFEWRDVINNVPRSDISQKLIELYEKQLISIGYPREGLKSVLSKTLPVIIVKNRRKVPLYYLVLASKHSLAQKIWNSIIGIDRYGQRELQL